MSKPVLLERAQNNSFSNEAIGKTRIYIIPTHHGFIYVLMLIAMLLGALNYNNSMSFMLCFFLTALAIINMLYTHRNLSGLVLQSYPPTPVFSGQTAQFPIIISNSSALQRFALEFTAADGSGFLDGLHKSDWTVCFDMDKKHSLALPYQTRQRGYSRINRVKIGTRFPLGLFYAWSYFRITDEGIVYPTPDGNQTIPPPQNDNNNDKEAIAGNQSGLDDFIGFRKYQSGDSIKNIAWKAFACHPDQLLSKQFTGQGIKYIKIDWGQTKPNAPLEHRLSQLCQWILLAEQLDYTYGLKLPDTYIQPNRGESHQQACLKALALFELP